MIVCENPEQGTEMFQKIIFDERMKRVRQTGLKDFTQSVVDEVIKG